MKQTSIVALAFFFLAACGAAKPPVAAEPQKPKPKAECVDAATALQSLLGADSSVLSISPGYLADGSCAVVAEFVAASKALPALQKIRAAKGAYTNFFEKAANDSLVPVSLWIAEPATRFAPVVDPVSGRTLDKTEIRQECESAAQKVRVAFPTALTTVQNYFSFPGCYVDIAFGLDDEFESFFRWKNPYSLDGNLLQAHAKRRSGVVTTVNLRPYRRM